MLIYAADDEAAIRKLLEAFLQAEGYRVRTFETGDLLMAAFEREPCDLVILDIMMPGTDGLSIARALRQTSRVPIMMLTARGDEEDIIRGLTLGSDDYMVKPFRASLLLVHIKALMRRVRLEQEALQNADTLGDFVYGDLIYHSAQRATTCCDKDLKLTTTEQNVLLYLMRKGGEAVSRQDLLSDIWGYEMEVETRVTDETVRRIRAKLRACGCKVGIKSVWGFGYLLTIGESD